MVPPMRTVSRIDLPAVSLIVLFLSLFLVTPATGGDTPGRGEADLSIEEMEEAIDSLRLDARYTRALEISKIFFEKISGEAGVPAYQVHDAGRLVETLRYISSLPESSQAELAGADRLTSEYMNLYQEGFTDSARTLAERQLSIRKRLLEKDHPDIAGSAGNLAYLSDELGDDADAEALYIMAISIERAALPHDHPSLATDCANLAGMLRERGRFGEAEDLFREALLIFRNTGGDESDDVAWIMGDLAVVLKDSGDYGNAEPFSRRALAIYRALYGDYDSDVADALNGLGVLLNAKGDLAGAEPLFYEALEVYGAILEDPDPDVAIVHNNLGSLLQDAGDHRGAERHYTEALRIFRRYLEPDDPFIAAALNNLADLNHDRADFQRADSLYREALEIRRSTVGDRDKDIAIFMLNIARNCRDDGRYECAAPLYPRADSLLRDILGDEHPYVAMGLFSWANFFMARGDFADSELQLSKAIPIYEVSRLRISPGLSRATFQKSPYPKLANAYLRQDKPEHAWPAAEKDLGRILADLLFTADRRSLTEEERATEDSLKTDLSDLEREIAVYRAETQRDSSGEAGTKLGRARDRLLRTEADWRDFQNGISRKYTVTEGGAYSLDQIQAFLSDQTAIIGWLDVEERHGEFASWIYLIRNSGPVRWFPAGAVTQERGDAGRTPYRRMFDFLWQCTEPGMPGAIFMNTARSVWNERFAPAAEPLKGVTQLVVIPSGAMLGIPVEAVIDDNGVFLCERFTVSYAPSATLFAWLQESAGTGRKHGKDMKMLLVGDPPFNQTHLTQMNMEDGTVGRSDAPDGGVNEADTTRHASTDAARAAGSLPRLPATREEILKISALAGDPTVLLGPEASEQEMNRLAESDAIGGFSVIHIATHALIDNSRPERSALVMSLCDLPDPLEAAVNGERIFDGLVTAGEIMREWRLDADLVTLSACETGLGKRVGGEGYIGFSNAILQAGARSLVVSLWKVRDRATAMLMQRFYANCLGRYAGPDESLSPMGKAKALQEAKIWLRNYTDEEGDRPFDHPFFWSAFILIGERGEIRN